MRIVWKDSKPKRYKEVRYRKHIVSGTPKGWQTDIPGDDNLYASHYCALNAIDKALGGSGQKGTAKKRMHLGIQVIGKKGESA